MRGRITRFVVPLFVMALLSSCVSMEDRRSNRQTSLDALKARIKSATVIAIVPRIGIIQNSSSAIVGKDNLSKWKPIPFDVFNNAFRGFDPRTGRVTDTPSLGEVFWGGLGNALASGLGKLLGSGSDQKAQEQPKKPSIDYDTVMQGAAESVKRVLGAKCVVMSPGSESSSDLIVYLDLTGSYRVSTNIDKDKAVTSLNLAFEKAISVTFIDTATKAQFTPNDSVIKGMSSSWIDYSNSKSWQQISANTFTSNWNYWLSEFFMPSANAVAGFDKIIADWKAEYDSGVAVIK